MKIMLYLLIAISSCFAQASTHSVYVPKISYVNEAKNTFIEEVSHLSNNLFATHSKSALAPFGGVKVTPFLELDLRELVIVTNSFPGTADEIESAFTTNVADLKTVLTTSLRNGSMSSSDVLRVNNGSQILSRLNLELGVREVQISRWSAGVAENFSDRPMESTDEALVTIFEFEFKGEKARLVFISSYIQAQTGFPEILKAFIPKEGFEWAYLSADGLGIFSAKRNNGLSLANQQLLESLKFDGAILLDYPTDKTYFQPQDFGGISFMNGRLDLEVLGLVRVRTIPISKPGVFGYCLRPGDEVRVYQTKSTFKNKPAPVIHQVGPLEYWNLK